jgi:hypothetical protein
MPFAIFGGGRATALIYVKRVPFKRGHIAALQAMNRFSASIRRLSDGRESANETVGTSLKREHVGRGRYLYRSINIENMRHLIVMTMALFINPAHADTYNYACTDRGKSYPLKVDDKQNTLTWQRSIYKINPQEDCAKFGWHAEKGGASFDFCMATKGYADFEQNGVRIQCNMKR